MSLWVIRIFFLLLCTTGGFAVSQHRPDVIHGGVYGILMGFGLGGLLVGLDHILKGFSLRAFSSATFGLFLGCLMAWMVDHSGLFIWVEQDDEKTRWLIRLGLFLGFSYLGMILAMRSNKEDFSLIIPFVRFKAENLPENLILLDTSVIIDGRIAQLIESKFVEGIIVVPQFVLKELQLIADSPEPVRRARGRGGLDMLNGLQQTGGLEVKIHEADFPEETGADGKLVRLAKTLGAKLYTNDFNLGKIAELQGVPHVNLNTLARALKPVVLPGDVLTLRVVREGREKGQGLGYLPDGTMVVINHAQPFMGKEVDATVQSLLQTGAGVIIFAELRVAVAA
jgi:uncharacterized protein YacL